MRQQRSRTKVALLRQLALALVFAGALAGALAGCGGSGNQGPTTILRHTFGASGPIHSGKLDVVLHLDVRGLRKINGPVDFHLSGPFQSSGSKQLPKFDFALSISASSQSFSAGAISTADKGFLLFQGTPYAVPDQQFTAFKAGYQQAQVNAANRGNRSSFASLGIDPTRWLVGASRLADQDVGGASTAHVRAGIDVGRFLDDISTLLGKANRLGAGGLARVPQQITPIQRLEIERSIKSASVDVFSGKDDNVLRRLTIVIGLDVPIEARSSAGGLSSGTITFDLGISDVNHSQTITAPANARPLSDLIRSSLAGAGTSTGTGVAPPATTGGPPATTGGSSATGTRYLACLQKAGQNIAAAQKCASLIGK